MATKNFLPVTPEELKKQHSADTPDFVLISADAYIDHPSFGAAIISRVLASHGYSIGMIAQPDWKNLQSFKTFGQPRLGFLISGGNIDSMVNHYTVAKKLRQKDYYSPGGRMGLRPDRATIVYANKLREVFGMRVPIMIGGVEPSLRRLSHYDYWDNKVRRSILLDSAADLLIYGMGEKPIIEIADALSSGLSVSDITFVRSTIYKTKNIENLPDYQLLPDYSAVCASKKLYAESFMAQYQNADSVTGKTLVEPYGTVFVVQNPPAPPLSRAELDSVYSLPYMRTVHPMYDSLGGVPAIEEMRFSITSSRGCFGNCNFCALTFHQGRVVQSRSHRSILREAEEISWQPDFKGYIHDVGGPTANFREPACAKQLTDGACRNKQCLFPKPCKNLRADHSDYAALMKKLRELPRIKKVFIRSGIRFDYLLCDKDERFFEDLVRYHISGQLKVAPEHISAEVLSKMGKPPREVYERFTKRYKELNAKFGMKQFLVPYLMSSHPGSTLTHAIELAEYLRDTGVTPEQVQDFYPTPGTLSTCMYYTETDPRNGKPVYVTKHPHEKAMQRALMQYKLPQNRDLVLEALRKAGRTDLIGFGKECLIRPGQRNPKEKERGKQRTKR